MAAERDGECGLAIVAAATMLEAYVNQFAMSELLPEKIDYFLGLRAPDRLRLLPRCVRPEDTAASEFASDSIHNTVARVFELRNRFVHGNLEEWDPLEASPAEVCRLWNASLDMLLGLEVVGRFRIPVSRFEQYEAELNSMRIAIDTSAGKPTG